jgi:hypothetical protein
MSYELKPKAGFDWKRVTWGRPDSVTSVLCSYCSAVFRDTEVPLMMFTSDGHAAKFCLACQKTWWGVESFDDEDEEEL